MSPLEQQRLGLNNLLADLYGRPTLVSDILRQHGLSDEQLQALRPRLDAYIPQLIQNLETWGKAHINPRRTRMLFLRYGLFGEPPQSQPKIGAEFNLSRQRVQQIQAQAFERIEKKNWLPEIEALVWQTAEAVWLKRSDLR